MKNILITGGCGFIASNILNHFVEKYPYLNFYNLDTLYYCASVNNIVVKNKPNYKFIKGNINSVDLLKHIFHEFKIDTVIHFAAQSHVDNSFSNPLQYTKDNIFGTHNLLEVVRQYGQVDKFIHVSTDEVYGESKLNDQVGKQETTVLCPTNPYAASKAGAELIAMSYYHSYGIPVIITRGNNVYGPRQYPEKLIPKFITHLNDNKKCTIHGTGINVRSFLYIDDVVDAFDVILHKGTIGEIYNIGTKEELSVLEVAKKLIENIKGEKIEDKWIEYVEDRKFNDMRYHVDYKKLIELGWIPKVGFEIGLNKTIKWYNSVNTKEHWKKI